MAKGIFNIIRVKTKEHTFYVPFLDPVHGDLDQVCYSFVAENKFHIAEELTQMTGEEFAELCPWDKSQFAQLKSGPHGGFFMAYCMPMEKTDA